MRQFRIFWVNEELACVVLEYSGQFAVAALYEGAPSLGEFFQGTLLSSGICQLISESNQSPLWLNVEGIDLSNDEIVDLLRQICE